ncbi:MAG TPA: TonB-dependent receptor [Steroidobacteraceae bacterium]|jgi:outer membrane receptor protein involved in Fe transport|nr:TonB-dependent receptor [Steroidobacteraceae bacterium]
MYIRAGIFLLAICAGATSFDALADPTPPDGSTRRSGEEIKARFDLPAEPLDKALRDLALQANRNISYEPAIVAGLQAPAIKGEFTVGAALAAMLTGTKLRVYINEDTIQILEQRDLKPPDTTRDQSDITEIIVTGTHIRGVTDSPVPVSVYTRSDIDASGVTTLQQFLQSLPQNSGGASENTIGALAANSQTNNTVNGSAPNLRGLGADATLVLINGHRVAPGNSDGSFVDISMIPLTAIERVEIVTDGASAIYGSDAVGGVVNIILRSRLDGAETRAQAGAVGQGSMHNVQVGQTVGDTWANGSALLSYQYFDQTPLSAASRDYLRSVPLPFNLLPEQVEHAAFANIDQAIGADWVLHGDAIYSHRSTYSAFTSGDAINGFSTSVSPAKIDGYSASLGASVKLPRQSELKLSATYSESDTAKQLFQTPSAAPLLSVKKTKSAIVSVDANLDGVLVSIPAGFIRYAVGTQYRKESFGNTYFFPATDNTFYPSRNVEAAYAELRIPVIGQANGSRGEPALELTLADRGEHYSDFGSANNPQIGALWKPMSGLTVRGTYGTSFKAPLLSELNPIPSQVVPFPGSLYNPGPSGTNPNVLSIYGGNPNLKPEKATVWTVGLDYKPLQTDGLSAKLSYYDIVFKNEIIVAGASICECLAFVDEAILGPQIVQRNPPASLVQHWISFPTYNNFFNIDPATIGAIFDSRSMNLSTVKTRGLDFGVGYKSTLLGARIDTGVDGVYIFSYDNKFSSSAPETSVLNTTYNPTELRLRGRATATVGPANVGVFLNFTSAYMDNNVAPSGHVTSWTTADAVIGYQFKYEAGPLRDSSISLSVLNLTDRAPPYVSNVFGAPITYDGANANALGRYFSLRLQKRW